MYLTSAMPLLILRQERNTSIKQWQRLQTDRLIPSRNDLQTVFQHLCCTQEDPSAKFQVHYLQNGKESLPFPTLPKECCGASQIAYRRAKQAKFS